MIPQAVIIIPFYNAYRGRPESDWFEQSIESAMKVRYKNLSIILVDDGSDDGSTDLAFRYTKNSSTIRLIRTHDNHGVASALNHGILFAAGCKYIATMGSDDLCSPDWIDQAVDFLEGHFGTVIIGSHYEVINEEGYWVESCDYISHLPIEARLNLQSGICQIGAPVFRYSLWNELGGYDTTNFPRCAEDFDFFLRTLNRYPDGISVIQKLLYSYRGTPGSLTSKPYWEKYYLALNMDRDRRRKQV